jgi:hypothetical protein
MTPQERIAQLDLAIEALRPAWDHFAAILIERADRLTQDLIAQDNEQTRGRIKALRDLLELPEQLQQERDGISAGLAE